MNPGRFNVGTWPKLSISFSLSALTQRADPLFGDDFSVRVQMPLAFGQDSQPDPDLAVVVGSPRSLPGYSSLNSSAHREGRRYYAPLLSGVQGSPLRHGWDSGVLKRQSGRPVCRGPSLPRGSRHIGCRISEQFRRSTIRYRGPAARRSEIRHCCRSTPMRRFTQRVQRTRMKGTSRPMRTS